MRATAELHHRQNHARRGRGGQPAALLATVWLTLLLASAAAAQNPANSEPPLLPLWEVTYQGNSVYLLGSIHVLKPDAYPLDDVLYQAFGRAGVVAFEMDLRQMMEAATVMLERGLYADGRTLRGVLPAPLFAEVEAQMTRLGLPAMLTQNMKPWLAALTLSSEAFRQGGFDAAAGVDLHFYERALQANKEIFGLESAAEQFGIFDGLDEAAQVEFLRITLDEIDTSVRELDELTSLWRSGQAEHLAQILNQELARQPQLHERILLQRNRNWVPFVESLIRSPNRGIVIVGVGHLVGEGSVVELLRQKGYSVIQLRSATPVPSRARQ
jgi:uncharacterized protein YbaP (TraB family)